MAQEFTLSYTASDINRRLGLVDDMIKSVNGVKPDASGNVQIQIPEETLEVPVVTTADNGKILQVVNGKWAAVTISNAEEGTF